MRTSLLGTFGAWRSRAGITPAGAAELEELGYEAIWIGGSPPGDLVAIESLLNATEAIPVVTGIVNMWKDEADSVAKSYHRLADRFPGRFVLGMGVGHREATEEYRTPIEKVKDYLDKLDAAGVPKDGTVLAALGPKMLAIAAERTAGSHPYLTTPRHTAFAREVIGAGPLLLPEQRVILEADVRTAREKAREFLTKYLDRVNYRNNLRRDGFDQSDFDAGGSDRLVDALVLHGNADDVAAGLTAHIDAGADHIGIQVIGDDPFPAYRVLARALIR